MCHCTGHLPCLERECVLFNSATPQQPHYRLFQVNIAERYEKRWAPTAAAHLCVSRAMAAELRDGWGVHARVLHDRPNDAFAQIGRASGRERV